MIEIVDLVGEPVKPGSLVAFSKSGVGELQVGIVIDIFPDRLTYFIKSRRKRYKKIQTGKGMPPVGPNKYKHKTYQKTFLGYGEWKIRKGWISLVKDKFTQNRLVVVKNPLFLLSNENIANQLEIIDMAKDAGLLPQDYIFGQPTDLIEVDLPDDDSEEEET